MATHPESAAQNKSTAVAAVDHSHHSYVRRGWVLLAIFAFALWLVGFACLTGAVGQEPYLDPLPIGDQFNSEKAMDGVDQSDSAAVRAARTAQNAIRQEQNRVRRAVIDVFRGAAPLAANQNDFDAWFTEFVLPDMTDNDPRALSQLGLKRKSLFDMLRGSNNDGAVLRLVETLLFDPLKTMATENYHPAIRVNAMAIIGELNQQEGIRNERPPTPYPAALTFLLEQLQDDTAPEFVKASAIPGIMRHVRIDFELSSSQMIANGTRDTIVSTMLGYLNEPAEGDDLQLHAWRMRQAIRILGMTEMPGTDAAVASALRQRMIGDDELFVRCDAAQAYGMLDFAQADQANATDVSLAIAELAVIAAKNELSFLDQVGSELSDLEEWRQLKPEDPNQNRGGAGAGAGDDDEQPGGAGGSGAPSGGAGGSGAPGSGAPGAPGAGGSGGAFGGRNNNNNNAAEDEVDLPLYVSNLSRRRLKAAVVTIQNALGQADNNDSGIWRYGTDEDKAFMTELEPLVESMLTTTDAGLAPPGRGSDEEPKEPLEAYTSSLKDNISSLEALIASVRGPGADSGSGEGGGDADVDAAFGGAGNDNE